MQTVKGSPYMLRRWVQKVSAKVFLSSPFYSVSADNSLALEFIFHTMLILVIVSRQFVDLQVYDKTMCDYVTVYICYAMVWN